MNLQIPKTTPANGTVLDATEAYVKSVMVIPEILSEIHSRLDEIAGALDMIALYAQKRGLIEGVITNEEVSEIEGTDEPAA